MTVRRALDALYDAAGYLAALFLVGTLAMVLLGIASRLLELVRPRNRCLRRATAWRRPDFSRSRTR